MQLTPEFRIKVREAVMQARENFSGSDRAFSKKLGIGNSVFCRMKQGETERILSDNTWLTLGREHNVSTKTETWKVARTHVYDVLEDNLKHCKSYSQSMILIDDCGIGKTFCVKHILRGMKDGFYLGCEQSKTKMSFVRSLAKVLGMDNKGRYVDVKNNLKYYINTVLSNPIIVLDDAGYLDYPAFLEIQELWNATEGNCAWYMIGDDSLQEKIKKGINSSKIGYRAIFSRFLDEYIHITPIAKEDRHLFLKDLFSTVAKINLKDRTYLNGVVNKCIGKSTRLRYLKNLIQINQY